MASFTLGTAAQATGMAKSSILRAIKRGVLSATRNEDGSWAIDPAELNRCFPLLAVHDAPPPQPEIKHDSMADVLIAELRATIADLRRDKDATIADLRSDRDHWRSANERSQAQLAEAIAAAQRLLPAPDTKPLEQSAAPIEQETTVVEQEALMAVEEALAPIGQEATPIEDEATAVDLSQPGWRQRALDMLASLGGAPARIRA
jgi:hypothetical protein